MDKKKNILEAWIMVEHLSEGDINSNDKHLKRINSYVDDYYTLFKNEILKKNNIDKDGGIVLYFNIFQFKNVISLLRKQFKLDESDEDIKLGNKFSFAVYFDKELKLSDNVAFFTESYYILKNKKVPKEKEFLEYEEENKTYIRELFECSEDENYKEFFNNVFAKLIKKYSLDLEKCRMKVSDNLKSDNTNLHSFFIADLEKAKSIKSDNLNRYLLGTYKDRINLDSRMNKDTFNPDVFYNILQPVNYPVTRFPSNLEYSLSLMQQVAVNLATGYDDDQMRSVNGPPGTGKTTLLRDIFAELIVEQAYDITELKSKKITDKVFYYGKAGIGRMPQSIADKGIVVASSNNTAVQNIVNELPLCSEIDKTLIKELKNADYFFDISNSNISTKWRKDETGKNIEDLEAELNEEKKFWGLFSLEGGKKANMDHILTALKHVIGYLEDKEKFKSNPSVYDEFKKEYDSIIKCKNEKQKIYKEYKKLDEQKKQLLKVKDDYSRSIKKIEKELDTQKHKFTDFKKETDIKKSQLVDNIKIVEEKIKNTQDELSHNQQAIEILKLNKPLFFLPGRKAYNKRMKKYSTEHNKLYDEISKLNIDREQLKKELSHIRSKENEYEFLINDKQNEKNKTEAAFLEKIKNLENNIQSSEAYLKVQPTKPLDMNQDYKNLQLMNPWFDRNYREKQSKLFIAALEVRKQFLYDNIKSVNAAKIIWNKQNRYLENKEVINEAWNWINMVIPVISSTFASINTMFKNLGENTIGYLFIDEAGQALPQASVGAISRSKQVMVLGDPAQIKPVLTLDSSILGILGKHYDVSDKYLSDNASTQTLVDNISKYGFYDDKGEWIDIPLWVHRRCRNQMYEISNIISYEGNMVQGKDVDGKVDWYDISGKASDKYVKEQGEFLKNKIQELINQNPKLIEEDDKIFVISPFRHVANELKKELADVLKNISSKNSNNKPISIGTVHTFQGKEAPIVFLVLGCDESNKGAANWAMGSENPNIMNVAATRAKEEFYIIGDKKLFKELGSDVINKTLEVIEKSNNENLEKQCD